MARSVPIPQQQKEKKKKKKGKKQSPPHGDIHCRN